MTQISNEPHAVLKRRAKALDEVVPLEPRDRATISRAVEVMLQAAIEIEVRRKSGDPEENLAVDLIQTNRFLRGSLRDLLIFVNSRLIVMDPGATNDVRQKLAQILRMSKEPGEGRTILGIEFHSSMTLEEALLQTERAVRHRWAQLAEARKIQAEIGALPPAGN